ncbi:hybrid sensor histidine kinase/response regulator [Oceanicoccus sagamiensis]|uniref:histidine kinase n=1 Tax=Oceanicoccus sagamiensis TaxID=716816 RepID=A0A1X9NI48_9GAMM|nr:hybrid sensor histidine kinase/response regulator [Oceanicoccus sagamiensis]ARN75515.1 hypothetical protein BST96_16215 [Oceanicoccus sagamiensis]
MRLLFSIIAASFLLFGSSAHANAIDLSQSGNTLQLNPLLDYLYDQEQSYHLGQIADPELSTELPWQDGQQRDRQLITQPGLYWFKGVLNNPSSQSITITLQTEYPSINVADLYLIDSSNTIETLYADAGMDDRFDNRPTPHRNLVNTLTLPANSRVTVVWRIYSEPLFQFRVTAWEPGHFTEYEQHRQMLYGMLYGILVVMALYNLFLYISTHQKSYIYYVLYVASAAYLIAADQGHIYQYIATDKAWAKLPIYALAYSFNILMFSQFCIYFLNLKKHSKALLKTIRLLSVIAALSIIVVIASNSLIALFLGLATTTALFAAALSSGVIVRKAGVISAGHFVIAIMILVFSLVADNMATVGLIRANGFTESLGAMGITLMLVFFSLALADRINQLQKESREAGRSMAKANEEKLKARTELLKSQMERIQLEQSSSEARLESRSKSDFLATMSHEIRTPMNHVLEKTELMKSTKLSDQQTQYLNTIERSSQSLLSIINDLQDFAKIEAGQMALDVASFNLETLLDDCISTFSLRAMEKKINFIADLEPGIEPVLKGDATKLRQIILNLLSNAFKFTEQGDILLKVSSTSKTSINCVELKFEIQDSGIGLTKAEQQRLFTPFQHADETTYGRYGGSGLGLAIGKQLAELMDGTIGVSSEAGHGSTFWFTARLLIDEHPDSSLLREKSSKLAGQRLLLLDPNPVSADIIARLLSSWKMDVVTATDVDHAQQQLSRALEEQQPFTVILAEYQLEGGNSLALAQQIQTNHKDCNFVLMATSRKLGSSTELSEAGIEIMLEKPVTNALLHDALTQAIVPPQQKAQQEAAIAVSTKTLTVLLAEDNQVNQLVIQGLLKKLNIIPDIAANGLQALHHYEQNDYDLILMDCEMPEMDGYEASHQIRAKEQQSGQSKVTIIALSAHARSDHKARALEAGMDAYLTKPITLNDLINALEAENLLLPENTQNPTAE